MRKDKNVILEQMQKAIFSKKKVVVLSGAGVSTASGIPDFRGEKGLYTLGDRVELILSKWHFELYPEDFYQFYTKNMMIDGYEPNIIHITLAALEAVGYISGIITQNVDRLHQKAGSKTVVDIHGDCSRYYCAKCKKEYSSIEYLETGYKCSEPNCDGMIRPDIVLYDEKIETTKSAKAKDLAFNADIFIVLGSSLTVSTASGLIFEFFRGLSSRGEGKKYGENLYIINKGRTPYDGYWWAENKCEEDLEEVFKNINIALREKIQHAINVLNHIYESNPQKSLNSKRLQMMRVLLNDFGFKKSFALKLLSNYTFQVRNVDLKKTLAKRKESTTT